MTGGGITARADFALTLIAELLGEDAARMVPLMVEYTPDPPFASGTPEEAPPHILAAVNARLAGVLANQRGRIREFVSRKATAPLGA